jgi:hypothetical protein
VLKALWQLLSTTGLKSVKVDFYRYAYDAQRLIFSALLI